MKIACRLDRRGSSNDSLFGLKKRRQKEFGILQDQLVKDLEDEPSQEVDAPELEQDNYCVKENRVIDEIFRVCTL